MNDEPSHKPALQNLHVSDFEPLVSPAALKGDLPVTEAAARTVVKSRDAIKQILLGKDPRMLVIIGPCSIHDPAAAVDYAKRLREFRKELKNLFVVMRVYFEKPRTTTGWKGLISDPHLDGSFDVIEGLRIARRLLIDVNELGLSTATEFLDPIVPQYIADLVAWAAIGARTTESQTHRQLASGLSMPVGFKNSTDGNMQNAINAMVAARTPHSFLGINEEGRSAVIRTLGNRWSHVVLRGGSSRPNFDTENLVEAAARLTNAGLEPRLMVDCSHANSGKQHERQEIVWQSVVNQFKENQEGLIGAMIESNLEPGRQDMADPKDLTYGLSITDECIGWDRTERMLREADAVLAG